MEQVEFGLFDWIDRGNKPLQKLYEERRQVKNVNPSPGMKAEFEEAATYLYINLPVAIGSLNPLSRLNVCSGIE